MNGVLRQLVGSAVARVGLAVLVPAIFLAGCSAIPGAPGRQAPAEIKVGAVVPLTGRYAAGGEQIKNGYELAVEAINGAGGVDVKEFGKKIPLKLVIQDDESDPTKTVQRLETLYTSDQVLAYLGGFGSDLHAAAAGIAEKNKTPYLGVAFALYQVHQKGFKYLFSPFPKSPGLARATFDLFDTLSPKPTKIAIFAEKTDWGAELRELWQKEITTRGYQLVADEEYAPGSKDFSPMILKAKSGGAQAVLALPNPPDGIAIVKQMKELDFNAGLYVMIRAADGLNWNEGLGKDGNDVLLMPGWSPDEKFPGVAELVQKHQAKYGKPAQATTGPAYAAVQILADAIARAGKLDRDALRDAIAATNLPTVMGPVKFNPDGTGQVIEIIDQWQNGKQALIWPKEQAAAAPDYPAKEWNNR
jgi:branched-chain amino acid transport system substrate-binding protein